MAKLTKSNPDKKPSWSDIKNSIVGYSHAELIALIKDLYSINAQTKTFLQSRFSTGMDALNPYIEIVESALVPDRNGSIKIAKAKKAISDYTKAVGDPEGILELMLIFVESGIESTSDFCDSCADYYPPLELMYEKALRLVLTMDKKTIDDYYDRFKEIAASTDYIGWGFDDSIKHLFYSAFPGNDE